MRHPKCFSTVSDFVSGGFQTVIDDNSVPASKTKTLVFVTGKFYYDLDEERENLKRNDVAIVRIEQLFPLPVKEIKAILSKYKGVKDIVWAQEEPRNMGAYSHLLMHFEEFRTFRLASRRYYGAPAAGSSVRSKKRHKQVIDYVFDKTKNNQRSK